MRECMKALVYHGPNDVQLDDKPRPSIQHSEDVILRVTSTALCGSDLHLYHGTVPGMEPGQTLGHEFMGVIEEAGPQVQEVKVGDKVVIPFNINCGRCWYCRHELWSQCDRSNPKGELGALLVILKFLEDMMVDKQNITSTICKYSRSIKSS